tara:strand:+ start:10174 stop:11037 length:864 start_codon:yes stop_codon:yes gene_type:complete
MATGDTGDFAGSLVEVLSDAMVHFSKANVCMPLVMTESRDKADTITFPVYNLGSATVTSADVAAHSEHDSTAITATELDSVKKTITLDMYSIRVPIHDEAVLSNANDITGVSGQLVGNAIAAKVDSLIVANFDNFSNTSNDTSNGISVDDIFAALGTLQANSAPGPYAFVHNPRAVYGSYGLSNDLVTSDQFGGSPTSQSDMLKTGFLGTLAGVDVYTTPEISISSNNAIGACFSKMALGFGYAGQLMRVEVERDAVRLKTDYVGSIFCGSVELADTYGVEMQHKVT